MSQRDGSDAQETAEKLMRLAGNSHVAPSLAILLERCLNSFDKPELWQIVQRDLGGMTTWYVVRMPEGENG